MKYLMIVSIAPFLSIVVFSLLKKPVAIFKNFSTQHPKFSVVNTVILVMLSILIGFLTDVIDFSDIDSSENKILDTQKEQLYSDIDTVYEIKQAYANSIKIRFDGIMSELKNGSFRTTSKNYLLLLSVILFIYVGLIILTNRARSSIEVELAEKKQSIEEMKTKMQNMESGRNYYVEVITQVNKVITSKIERLEQIKTRRRRKDTCKKCQSILGPELDIYISLKKIVHFIQRIEKEANGLLRIALFVPDERNEYFICPYSIDSNDRKNVVNSFRGRYKENFKINENIQNSLVAFSYFEKKIIIVENCLEQHDKFKIFDTAQSERLKSIIALPLMIEHKSFGAITIDSDKVGVFKESDDTVAVYSILAEQFSRIIYHDFLLKDHFSNLVVSKRRTA